ncbi:protein FAM124B-like [Hoplias malabaricus]|uniref:protein FAM124B-like n=1 Tax=Hoplias malabaricus TaxID=27720 RepID=UPI0034617C12
MLRKPCLFNNRVDDEATDSGAETAGSDCSKMYSSSIDLMAGTGQEPPPVIVHLLSNPGDSLLLQHTLDRLLEWVFPGLRLFHVSERACPVRDFTLSPVSGYPSLAVTLFLHESFGEAYGEERILRVLDFLQRPPWQYHHTESFGSRTGQGVHISAAVSSSNPSLRPYLLPSRDFFSLGTGMPVWGVRPVHCGGEVVRLTLHSGYENFEDSVRLYETVLRKRAEEQKAGFCWFTLRAENGFRLQLALKRLSPGVRVEPCSSAVLQFNVCEIGQLVPLLPNTCSPISATRWQTEDLDGNKILFQVKGSAQPPRLFTSAFPLSLPSRSVLRSPGPPQLLSAPRGSFSRLQERAVVQRVEGESVGSSSVCSTPPGSSCYSSQRSSPSITRLLQEHQEPQETQEEEPETDVDTGRTVGPLLHRPTAVGSSSLETLARDLRHGLREAQRNPPEPLTQTLECLEPAEQVDEFFI